MQVIVCGEKYQCSRAVKGANYARLYDERGNVSIEFIGVSNFDGYFIDGGEWEIPEITEQERTDARIAAIEAVVKGTPTYGELLEAVNVLLGETP